MNIGSILSGGSGYRSQDALDSDAGRRPQLKLSCNALNFYRIKIKMDEPKAKFTLPRLGEYSAKRYHHAFKGCKAVSNSLYPS